MKYYYLAFIIWIAIIVMCVSLVCIPALMYLRDKYEWWWRPLYTARVKANTQYSHY